MRGDGLERKAKERGGRGGRGGKRGKGRKGSGKWSTETRITRLGLSPKSTPVPHFDSRLRRSSRNIPQIILATLATTPTRMPSRSTRQDASHESPSHSPHAHRPKPPSRTPSFLAGFVLTPLSSLSQTSQAFPQLKQSYENLVALANAREALRQTRREAAKHGKQVRRMVWRDRGEPPVELRSFEDCIEHAVRGGSRKYPFVGILWVILYA